MLGELAPKSIAIRRAERVSLNAAVPLYLFHWLMYPFIYVLNGAANVIVRRLGVELASEGDAVHSVDELRSVLRASHRHGELGVVETQILEHGLDFGDLVSGRFTGLLHIKDLVSADERLRDIRDLHPYLRRLPYFDEKTGLLTVLNARAANQCARCGWRPGRGDGLRRIENPRDVGSMDSGRSWLPLFSDTRIHCLA